MVKAKPASEVRLAAVRNQDRPAGKVVEKAKPAPEARQVEVVLAKGSAAVAARKNVVPAADQEHRADVTSAILMQEPQRCSYATG